MTTAATISIQLEAQTALLRKGFHDARQEVRGFRQQVGRAMRLLQASAAINMIQQLVGALRGLNRAIQETADRAADVGDFADRIGMSPQRLQVMRAMVEQFGSNADQLNMGLQRMTRRLQDAAAKGGPLADELERLGLNVQDLAQLSPDQQFLRIADAIAGMDSAGEQVALTFKLVDSEGVSLVETFRQGSKTLEQWIRQNEDVVALNTMEIRQAQELSAEMKKLNREYEVQVDRLKLNLGFVTRYYTELWRFYNSILEQFINLKKGFEELFATPETEQIFGPIKLDTSSVETLKDVLTDLKELSSPAALTSTTASGFGALQEWLRQEKDSTYERDMLAKMDTLIEVTADDRVDVVEYSV